jgi:hypothetical protein
MPANIVAGGDVGCRVSIHCGIVVYTYHYLPGAEIKSDFLSPFSHNGVGTVIVAVNLKGWVKPTKWLSTRGE